MTMIRITIEAHEDDGKNLMRLLKFCETDGSLHEDIKVEESVWNGLPLVDPPISRTTTTLKGSSE